MKVENGLPKNHLVGGFKYFLKFSPLFCGNIPILTSIFFQMGGSTTNRSWKWKIDKTGMRKSSPNGQTKTLSMIEVDWSFRPLFPPKTNIGYSTPKWYIWKWWLLAKNMAFFFLYGIYVQFLGCKYMGVSKNRGTPKWMVYIMENPIKMDDLGVTTIFGNPHIEITPTSHSFSGHAAGCQACFYFHRDSSKARRGSSQGWRSNWIRIFVNVKNNTVDGQNPAPVDR